jgi:hypothetical protein
MNIEIRNLPDVKRMLGDLADTQLPFAMSVIINRTMFKLRAESAEKIKTVFDKPTPGVQKSTRVEKTTKTNFNGRLLLSEWKTPVFRVHESGLQRYQVNFERQLGLPKGWFAVPTKNMKLNQYGNQDSTKKRQILVAKLQGNANRKRQFLFIDPSGSGFDTLSGRLSPGIYETKAGSNELIKLYHYVKNIEYKPILQWEQRMNEKAKEILPGIAKDSVELAIRTAIRR